MTSRRKRGEAKVGGRQHGPRRGWQVRRPARLCLLLDATSAGKGRRLAFDPPHGLRIEHSFAARRALEKAELRNRIPATPELTRPAPPDLSTPPATTGRKGLNPP